MSVGWRLTKSCYSKDKTLHEYLSPKSQLVRTSRHKFFLIPRPDFLCEVTCKCTLISPLTHLFPSLSSNLMNIQIKAWFMVWSLLFTRANWPIHMDPMCIYIKKICPTLVPLYSLFKEKIIALYDQCNILENVNLDHRLISYQWLDNLFVGTAILFN